MFSTIGRRLSQALSRCSKSSFRTLSRRTEWVQQMPKPLFKENLVPNKPEMVDLTLISRRFLLYTNANKSSETSSWVSFFTSKFWAAFGAFVGFGSEAVYSSLVGHGNVFRHSYSLVAHCEGETTNPECEQECQERKCHSSACFRLLDCEEEMIIKANNDLRKALMDVRSKVVEYTEAALEASCEAICMMQHYMDGGYALLDNECLDRDPDLYEKSWICMFEIAKARCQKVREAMEKSMCAWELLCKLRENIEEGKACKYTQCNPLLCIAEECFNCAEQGLLEMRKRMDTVACELEMVEQYKDVITNFKGELRDDLDKLPEGEKCDVSYEQEKSLLIDQAYKRVIRLQKELAQLQICTRRMPAQLKHISC